MPIEYYIVTTKFVTNLVDNNDLDRLDDYLINGHSEDQELYCDMDKALVAPWVTVQDSYKDRLYHILSYATNVSNLNVLNYYSDKIDINYYPDGNSYNLIHLSITNYIESFNIYDNNIINIKNKFDTIILLIECLQNNINFEFPLHGLTEFCDSSNNYDLVTILINKYDISADFLYSSSINNDYSKVFDYLIDNFYHKINFKCIEEALQISFINDNYEIIKHVLNKIKIVNIEEYEKLKHLHDPTRFIIKSVKNLIIPEEVTYIKTDYHFNKSISNVKLPNNLKEIHFGGSFNKSLDDVIFPDSVEKITFGKNNNYSSFKKSLKNVKFPKSLKVFWNNGWHKDENITDIKFPDSIQELKEGSYYSDDDDYDYDSDDDSDDEDNNVIFNCIDNKDEHV